MKGQVRTEEWNGTLRLRFTGPCQGGTKRYCLGTGIKPGDKAGAVRLSQAIAALQKDLDWGELDPTLNKYKAILKPGKVTPPPASPPAPAKISPLELWDRFAADRLASGTIRASTANTCYRGIRRRLAQVPANVPPEQYRAYYLEKYARETARRDLQHLCACFQWGVSQKLTESNPLQSPGNPIKVTRRGNSRAAFSQAERDQILAAFQGDIFKSPYSKVPHSYYFDFVWFLFHTGCRLEDAVGLRWEHISPDFSRINFCSAIPSGYRVPGTPKTGARVFDCKRIAGLQEFLRDRRTRINSPWVFPSVTGRPIHADNFGRRIWKPIVERLVAEGRVEKYLPAYHCRHSFISHCRWAGVSPEEIAAMVGNSPEVIFRHYSVAPKNLAPISL